MNAPEKILGYHEIAQVTRDICFLYHELSEYSGIIGDLDYSFYNLPYWEYLEYGNSDSYDAEFIRDGCLVMLLAMAWEQIDGAGSYINDKIDTCLKFISYIEPDSESTVKLIDIVKMALRAEETSCKVAELEEQCQWVYLHYVRGYFRERSGNTGGQPDSESQ